MKKIILLLSIFIIWGCGSRKVDNYKNKGSYENKSITKSESGGEISSNEKLESSYSIERNNLNIGIKSNGSEYSFKWGGFEFTGNADVTVSDNKQNERTKIKWEYWKHYTYYYITNHINITNETWLTHHKVSDKKALPWWVWVIFGAVVYVAGIITVPLFEKWIGKDFH
ncbi:hypothetical protein CMU99_16415 [Elizabethkingia anophelis]|nr:hypothetical protein [Elizabethkingia anophelis]